MKVMEPSDRRNVKRQCLVPKSTILYPFCEGKVKFVLQASKSRCFAENNVRCDDVCSALIYMSEIEPWCPPLPWRSPNPNVAPVPTAVEKIKLRNNFHDLLEIKMHDFGYKWMRQRIRSMENDWKKALLSLRKERDLSKRRKKKILVFVGAFAFSPFLTDMAFSGGPLGELVQWSDTIASLYLLGHDLEIVNKKEELPRFLPRPDTEGCFQKHMVKEDKFDLIYTDIAGFGHFRNILGPFYSRLKCKIRLLDSFGTEAEFNIPAFNNSDPAFKSIWGGHALNLRQFMTMFPHSPDNSFLGFVSDSKEAVLKRNALIVKKNKGLVYGKEDYYWQLGSKSYLDQIHKHVEIHGTFNASLGKRPDYIPDYVINHGVVNRTMLLNLLMESKVFIGFGFPFEGPAPLEAFATGTAFLNRKFIKPLNRYNDNFFRNKPTRRPVTSQNPYAEQFIGPPYVYTIDITNISEVENTMKKILKTPLKPFIPYEYTQEGMLERTSSQVENMDLCRDNIWPPLKNLVILKGGAGQSCKDVCWEKDLICEPSYWEVVNKQISFNTVGITCLNTKNVVDMTIAPSYHHTTKTCYFQNQPLLFSCVKSDPSHSRVCPCRDYVKGQVALCKGCW